PLGDAAPARAEDGRMKNGAIAVPGPCHVAILLAPPALQEGHQDQVVRAGPAAPERVIGITLRVGRTGPAGDPLPTCGTLQEEAERRAIRFDPGAEFWIGLGPGDRPGAVYVVR